jgi:hypothetical protein
MKLSRAKACIRPQKKSGERHNNTALSNNRFCDEKNSATLADVEVDHIFEHLSTLNSNPDNRGRMYLISHKITCVIHRLNLSVEIKSQSECIALE